MNPTWRKIRLIISLGLSIIFALQAFTKISIIPLATAATVLGFPRGFVRLFFVMFVAVGYFIIKNTILDISGARQDDGRRYSYFLSFMRVFAMEFMTFMTFAIFEGLNIFPRIVDEDQLLNWFIFWFFFFNVIGTILYYIFKHYDKHITYTYGENQYKWPPDQLQT